MKTFLTRHGLLLVHGLVLCMLMPGLVNRTGTSFLPEIGLYVGALLLAHVLLLRTAHMDRLLDRAPNLRIDSYLQAVLAFQVVLMVVYWSLLGEIPLWTALHEADDLVIVSIRRAAGEAVPTWLSYLGHLQIKALVPVALVLAWTEHRKLFWALAIAASFFAVSLLAKSLVVTLFVPLWIAFLLGRRWPAFAVLTATFVVLTVGLSWAANPQKFRTTPSAAGEVATVPEDRGVREHGLVGDAFLGVGKRLVLMPGNTVAAWSEHIPRDIPFVKGAAVRPLALVLGKPYRDLSEEIYALEYPDMAAKHVPGTMGTASFMYGYANFDRWGLVCSGLITALMLAFARACFGSRWRWAIVLNVFPLLSLSGGALPTVLLTHGWALTLVLYVLLRPAHDPGQ